MDDVDKQFIQEKSIDYNTPLFTEIVPQRNNFQRNSEIDADAQMTAVRNKIKLQHERQEAMDIRIPGEIPDVGEEVAEAAAAEEEAAAAEEEAAAAEEEAAAAEEGEGEGEGEEEEEGEGEVEVEEEEAADEKIDSLEKLNLDLNKDYSTITSKYIHYFSKILDSFFNIIQGNQLTDIIKNEEIKNSYYKININEKTVIIPKRNLSIYTEIKSKSEYKCDNELVLNICEYIHFMLLQKLFADVKKFSKSETKNNLKENIKGQGTFMGFSLFLELKNLYSQEKDSIISSYNSVKILQ